MSSTQTNDGRYNLDHLYASFRKLKDKGWIEDVICEIVLDNSGIIVSLPIIALRTPTKGKSIWILSGIHGEEPAGPNAIADGINDIAKLGEKYSVVLLPLCNPSGYFRNWRYLNMQNYSKDVEGLSVSDSEHLLLSNSIPRKTDASSSTALFFTNYILNLLKHYEPFITLDLHEDNMLSEGYIYSQGKYGVNDKIAKSIVEVLKQSNIPVQMDGKTRFDEQIINGIVGLVSDGSIDELFSANKIFVDGKIIEGPRVETVIVFETPAKNTELQKRKLAHLELLKSLGKILG